MLIERVHAFVWTCALELPVYAWWLHRFAPALRPWPTIASVLALQVATQPLLWEYSFRLANERSALWVAELIVCTVEAALLVFIVRKVCQQAIPGPIAAAAAVTANALSWGVGTLLNRWVYA
jgi:uncharacterized protein (DUF697 family)